MILQLTALALLAGTTLARTPELVSRFCQEDLGDEIFVFGDAKGLIQSTGENFKIFDAMRKCNEFDAALLYLDSEEEFDIFFDIASAVFPNTTFHVGLMDLLDEGGAGNNLRFNFLNQSDFGFTIDKSFYLTGNILPWAIGSPNDKSGKANCVVWDLSLNRWESKICGDPANFICRRPGCPTASPTISPTETPTTSPTISPTLFPSTSPSQSPTFSPNTFPTDSPTETPSLNPTSSPTLQPSFSPTPKPTVRAAVEVNVSTTTILSLSLSGATLLTLCVILALYVKRKIHMQLEELDKPIAIPVIVPPEYFEDKGFGDYGNGPKHVKESKLDFEF